MISYLKAPKVIVGAGGAAWWVLEGFTRNSIAIDGFIVTQELPLKTTCGLSVYTPSTWESLPNNRSEYIAIIGIMNPDIDIDKIAATLRAGGWMHVMTFSQYATGLLKETGMNVCMLDPTVVLSNMDGLAQVREFLSDEESKTCLDYFTTYVQTFADKDTGITPNPYFPPGIPKWKPNLRVLDCGAFDGDTLRQATDNGYSIESAICFEPDSANFKRLSSNIQDKENHIGLPLAVGESTSVLQFNSQSSSGSQIVSEGGIAIQCVSIDEAFPNWNPNLIKMDIEGSEISALKGAEQAIRQSRPDLAISIYHKPTDIWFIPIWLRAILGENTRFYLRRHSRAIADTVLYVFPN